MLSSRTLMTRVALIGLSLGATRCACAQNDGPSPPLRTRESITQQHRRYVADRIRPLEPRQTADQWRETAKELRGKLLSDIVFRGTPEHWRSVDQNVVWHDTIETGKGYRIRKLRFEALPGLWIPALLYEPDDLTAPAPVVLNVNGHSPAGKATPAKQLRCINLAKRGMLALNLEWIGMGQLRTSGLAHNNLAKLDLCGQSGLSVFYLAMQRGLDLLLAHPKADATRTAVTGLSGGGWQTILLSALDTRVTVTVPVAGHSAITQRLTHAGSIGDLEQIPVDLAKTGGYVHLNALMVPRPMLMIYNAKDNCCFVADTVKPNTYDPIAPFYERAGVPRNLAWYRNTDPGTHNYDRDNREQLYRFLNKHFAVQPALDREIPSEDEVRSAEQLTIPLPAQISDFNTLAAQAARVLPKPLPPAIELRRTMLRKIIGYEEQQAAVTKSAELQADAGLHVRQLRLRIGDWNLPATIIRGEQVTRHVLMIADAGMDTQWQQACNLAKDGARVITFDPILFGHSLPRSGALYQNAMLLATVGDRPLGIQAAQLNAVVQTVRAVDPNAEIDLVATGPRASLAGRCTAALNADAISSVTTHDEMESLKQLLKPGSSYSKTPEAYCFGLLEYFDVDRLAEMAAE